MHYAALAPFLPDRHYVSVAGGLYDIRTLVASDDTA
jgi:hypothetical protein